MGLLDDMLDRRLSEGSAAERAATRARWQKWDESHADRRVRAHEHAKAATPGGKPFSSDVADAMMNAEQHAALDGLKAMKNLTAVKATEAVQGDSGDIRVAYRKRYSNGTPGPAQQATVKDDGRVVNADGAEMKAAPAEDAVKKAAKKVVLKAPKKGKKP